MDKSYVIPVLTELREMRAKTFRLSDWLSFTKLKEDDCKFILSRAIELIEWLDGALEDCEDVAEEAEDELKSTKSLLEETKNAYDTCKIMFDKNAEEIRLLRKRYAVLIRAHDDSIEHWTKHCENLFNTHRKCLAEKDREIYELKLQRDQYSGSAMYWKCKCDKLEKAKTNNPANFCGNCSHYAQMGKDDGDFEGICTQHYIKRVEPDDASCKHFKPTYDTRVVIAKPEFPCCEHCNHDDCDNCTLCPF